MADRPGLTCMKPHLRAAIAYVAARLILPSSATGLFDESQFRRVLLSGAVDRTVINVFDHERRCFIVGAGDGVNYTLFHQGEGYHVSLSVREHAFWGHDYGHSTRFDGTVDGNSVTVHEHESDARFRYVI